MPVPPNLPGGQLYMEYRHTPSGERHSLRIHLAYFDPAPIDETNNRAYTSDGPVVPTDATIVDSYNSFAALWQQYYNADWELSCVALLRYSSFTEVVVTPTPNYPVYHGTDTTDISGKLYFERKFKLLSKTGSRRELVLAQVIDTTLRPHAFYVGSSSGGVDPRDQALMAYFSGTSGTGFVMPDGNYAFSDTEMSVWWNKQPQGVSLLDGNCLPFPLAVESFDPHPRLCVVDEDGVVRFTFYLPNPAGPATVKIDREQVAWEGLGSIGAGSGYFVRQIIDGHDLRIIDGDGQDFRVFSTDGEVDGTLKLVLAYIAQQWKFFVDDVPQLTLPFETCASAPTEVLAKDPVSGVPGYYAEGNIGVIKPVGDAPIPTGTPADQSRCGAAFSMAHELWTSFNRLTGVARSLIAIGTGFSGPTVAQAIISVFLGPEAVVAEWIMFALAQAINATISAAIADTIGALSGPQENALANALYCQLSEVGGVVQVTQTTIDNWRAAVPTYVTGTVAQLDILNLLMPAWTLEAWRRYAYLGAANPSTSCGGFTCP